MARFRRLEADLIATFSSRTLQEVERQRQAEDLQRQTKDLTDITEDWNAALKDAGPRETGDVFHDYGQFRRASRDPAWKHGIHDAGRTSRFNVTQFQFPRTVTTGQINRREMEFTHEQAVAIIRAAITESNRHYRFDMVCGGTSNNYRDLARAIKHHDAELAGLIRATGVYPGSKDKKLLLEKLCPLEAARDRAPLNGSQNQKQIAAAFDDLKFEMGRLPGLWVRVKSSWSSFWPELDHQIFPYFSQISSLVNALKQAAQTGEDITVPFGELKRLHERAQDNFALLKKGKVIRRSLPEVRAAFPPGQIAHARSPYVTNRAPEWQQHLFDASGRPNLQAIVHAESLMLENLSTDIDDIEALRPSAARAGYGPVLLPPGKATRPSRAWLKAVREQLSDAQIQDLLTELRQFEPFNVSAQAFADDGPRSAGDRLSYWLNEAAIRQGMIWAAHLAGETSGPVLYDVARRSYAKHPGIGIINEKLGNAAVVSLAMIENGGGIPFLTRLQARTPQPKIRKRIAGELDRAAKAAGMSRMELEELSVEDHGLAHGLRRIPVGKGAAHLVVDGRKVTVKWENSAGKLQKSAPAELRESDAAGVRNTRALAKEIEKDLVTQKARLEGLYLTDAVWNYRIWRERYADHGTMAVLSRSLIWSVERNGACQTVLPTDGGCLDLSGEAARIDDDAKIRLWHPLDAEPQEIGDWRHLLMDRNIVQPFRQVWREVFTLTDAERETGTYSNRFAGHILHQHQMMSLAHSNGWQCTHRVGFDTPSDEPSHIRIPEFGLQAEYWTAPAGRDGPTSEGGAFLYIVTDRLKFHRLDEKAKFGRGEEVELTAVPPRIFSEIMRACDLFVSVASIGLDPEWRDKGREAEHPSNWRREADDYWNWTHDAPIAGSAKRRREMLAALLPRLKNAGAFQLDENHLRVFGKKNTYLIHLGSGGIQKADTRSHICIVPKQMRQKPIALPFGEDATLSLIVSKAFLLATDDKITDPVILQQL